MGLFGKVLTWILLALACNYIIKLVLLMDWNKNIYGHQPGPCQTVKGIEFGADDIEVLGNETVLVTSGLRLKVGDKKEHGYVRGRIFAVSLTKGQENKIPTSAEVIIKSSTLTKETFNPHGISAWTSPNGFVNVYVVNHLPNGTDAIECFTYKTKENKLIHQKTIAHPLIYSANSVVAVGPERFYVSNDHYFAHPLLKRLEMVSLSSLGSIVFCASTRCQLVDQWLQHPNGLAVNKNKTSLYVSLPMLEQVRVYKIKKDDSLVKVSDMSLLSSPSNIWYENGADELWAGCHPIAHKIFKHLAKPKSTISPSQVLRIRPGHRHSSWTITEPFADDGRQLSASTIAVYVNENLLVGTMHHKLMWCPVPDRDLL